MCSRLVALRVFPQKRWGDRDVVDYEQRTRLAERHGKVPAGKRLTVTSVDGELKIVLVDNPTAVGGRAELRAVQVPDTVGRYHPAARDFRDRANRHEMSRQLVPRATRIIHALAVEAERRGWVARPASESKNGHGRTDWTATKDGHLQITADGTEFWLRLREDGVHARGAWEEDVGRYRNVSRDSFLYRGRELPAGPYHAGGAGRLMIELHVERSWIYKGRQSRFADRQSWTLEGRLPHLIREIEERIAHARRVAEQERIAAEKAAGRAADERERTWHQLMAQARERLVETHRTAQLRVQADAWSEADRLRRYCDAMDAAHGEHPPTAQWIAWARAHADQIDPLTEPPTMPKAPEATPEALQPHLPGGWSAHGPEHDHHPQHMLTGRLRP
jgi:hypothetical protein